MANGFGLNAAVQAFPSAYEFGRSLVGQDNASLDRAFKEKALAAEMAMKQQQMEDEAAYKAGVLRNTDYANRTQRMEADSIGDYRGIQGRVLAEGAPYENRERAARTSRIEQMLPVELQDARSVIAARNDQNRREGELHPLNMEGKRVNADYMRTMNRQMGASADAQQLKNQEWEAEDRYGKVLPKIIADPYDPSISPEDRRRALAEAGVMANPHAERAVQLFDAATAHYQKTGKQDLFNDELRLEMGKALQPLIDQNTGSAPGSFRFAGFEPAEGGGVRMKLAKVDPKSGQPLSTENLYVTNGRVPMADGGVPSVFTPSDVHHVLSGLRSASDWQKANPDLAQELWEMNQAHSGVHDGATYAKNRASMALARAKAEKDDAKLEQTMRTQEGKIRNALTADFVKRLDEMAGFDSKDFVDVDKDGNQTRNTAEIQQAKRAREEAIQEFRAQIKDMPFEELQRWDADSALGTPVMQETIAPYLARSRRSPTGSSYTPPTQGGIQNSPAYGTPAAGGRPSPFPQRP